MRKKVYELLERGEKSRLSKAVDLLIIIVILLNIIAVIIETVDSIAIQYAYQFRLFEEFSILFFTVEYILRIWSCVENHKYKKALHGRMTYAITPFAIIDLLAIIPFYLPLIIPFDLRVLRAIRIYRIILLFKIFRYSRSLKLFKTVLQNKLDELFIAFAIILFMLIFASSLMYYIERYEQPDAFASIPAAMWWGVGTLTTIGYGDAIPITPLGKFIGAIIGLLGIGLFALPVGIISSGFSEVVKNHKQKPKCPKCGEKIDL